MGRGGLAASVVNHTGIGDIIQQDTRLVGYTVEEGGGTVGKNDR